MHGMALRIKMVSTRLKLLKQYMLISTVKLLEKEEALNYTEKKTITFSCFSNFLLHSHAVLSKCYELYVL